MSTSRVESVAEQLAFQIAARRYAPGERLPSVRKLAQQFNINPSTVQVVLARLESQGFVEAHRGVGFLVRDIERLGGIETWRYVFRFAQRLPDRASGILADVLALRRTLVVQMLRNVAAEPGHYPTGEIRRAVEQMRLTVASTPVDLMELAKGEIHAFRTLTLTLDHTVVTAVLNSIGALYLSEERVVRAMYEEPGAHVAMWLQLLDSWDDGKMTQDLASKVGGVLEQFDAGVVERYRTVLAEEEE